MMNQTLLLFRTAKLKFAVRLFLILVFAAFGNALYGQMMKANSFHTSYFLLEPNKGQLADKSGELLNEVKYYGEDKKAGVYLYLKNSEIDFVFVKTKELSKAAGKQSADAGKVTVEAQRMEMHMLGANPATALVPSGKQAYFKNYYLGHCSDGILFVPTYNELTYKEIYSHIDMIIEVQPVQHGIKYSFIVHPGGNPADIKLEWKGGDLNKTKEGNIKYSNPLCSMTESAPVAYQFSDNNNESFYPPNAKCSFKLNDNTISFTTAYEKENELIIDPTLTWGTYMGGSGDDRATDDAPTDSNMVFIGGYTSSSSGIATKGAYQTSLSFGPDGFISKFDSSGKIKWSTYYGDISTDAIWGLAKGDSGYVYGFGKTSSSSTKFASSGAYQTKLAGSDDAFIVKLNRNGGRAWATYFGGSLQENVVHGCTDDSGNVFLCGETFSTSGIATSGAYQTSFIGGSGYPDAYLAKFNSAGKIKWATYYGGSEYDQFYAAACDKWGNIYLKAWEQSTSGVATSGAYQTSLGGGGGDAALIKFDRNGKRKWGTYFGGSDAEGDGSLYGQLGTDGDVATDPSGNVYIITDTKSSSMATSGAYQTSVAGDYDVLLGKFDSAGKVKWITYYGGSGFDFGKEIYADNGGVFIVGETESSSGIATSGSYQSSYGGSRDAFLVKFDPTGKRLWGTYYGGSGADYSGGITTDNFGSLYVTGVTASSSKIATGGAYQTSLGGSNDAFLMKYLDSIIYIGCEIRPRVTKNAAFAGKFAGGTKADPDVICPGTKAVYNIGSRFPDSSYNKTWTITSLTLKNVKGTASKDTAFLRPSKTQKGLFTFSPASTASSDSFILRIDYKADTCKQTVIRYILVSANPKASFTASSGECQNTNVSFTNTTTTSVGTLSYIWYFGNGAISTSQIPKYSYPDTGSYVVSLVASNGACKDSVVQKVTVYPSAKGAEFSKGQPFKGLFNSGTSNSPDYACGGDTLTYAIKPPVNFSNADYDSKWTVKKVSFYSYGLKTVLNDTATVKPGGSDNFLIKLVPPSKYEDSVLVVSITIRALKGGCDTTFERIIQIGKPPIAKFGFTEVCEGQETTFIDSSDKNGNSFIGYYWDFGDGGTATQSYPTHTYAKAGTYNVTLTVISSQGCADAITKKVKVYAKPQMKIVTSPLCLGEKITFLDSSKTDGKVTKYYWQIGPTYKTSLVSPTYTFTKTGKYTVMLAIVVSTGCVDTLREEVEIVTKPKADFTFNAACIGMASTFTNTSTGDSNMTYYWDFGDGTYSSDKNPSKTYYVGGSSQVTLTVKAGASGCTSSITKNVAPFNLPKAKIGYTPNCVGNPLNFYDSSDYANSAVKTLRWDFGDGNSVVDKGTPTHIYTNAGTYTVSLWIQNANGCTDSTDKVIKVNAQPSADFSSTTVCVGQPTVFTNNSTSSGGVPAYEWDFGDTTSTSSVTNPTHTYKYPGLYRATLKVTAGGCSAIKKVDVTVNPGPVPSWTTTMLGRKVTFNPDVTTFSSYMWYFGDGDSSSLVSPSHIYASSTGTYTVTLKVTDAQGCKGEKTVVMKLGTGIIEDVENKWNVNVYPNPFNGTTKVSYTLEKRSTVKLSLCDIQGREVMLLKDGEIQAAGQHEVVIDGSKMPAGVYILKVIVGEQCYNTKIVQLK